MHPVAGAGEIVSWERLATNRYNILVKGEWRIRIDSERPSDTLYRFFAVRKACDQLDDARKRSGAEPRQRRRPGRLDRPADLLDTALAEGQAPGVIADRIAAAVVPDSTLRQELLETLDVTRRLERLGAALDQLVNELRRGRE